MSIWLQIVLVSATDRFQLFYVKLKFFIIFINTLCIAFYADNNNKLKTTNTLFVDNTQVTYFVTAQE